MSKQNNKKEIIIETLKKYILNRKQKGILKLFGKIDYDPQYDYKKNRKTIMSLQFFVLNR